MKAIKHIFTGYTSDKSQDVDFQCRTIALISAISAPAAGIFSLINFLHEHINLAIAEVIATFLFAYCYKIAFHHHSLVFKRSLLLVTAMSILFIIFLDGGVTTNGAAWSFLVPFLACLLMGLPRAWYWIIGYSAMLLSAVTAHLLGYYSLPYTHDTLLYLGIIYVLSALFSATFEAQFERLHVRYEKSIQTLEDLKENLESNIHQRTLALEKSNEKLLHEVEKHKRTSQALQDSERRFFQSQKMETVGTLVGGIAHDFNNMLAGINANLFMIKKQAKSEPEILNRTNDVEQLVMNASDMIRQLLTFARKDNVKFEPLNLVDCLNQLFKLAQVSISKNINVSLENKENIIPVYANATQLQQVLMNMLNNARDALKGVDSPSIKVKLVRYLPSERFKKENPEMNAHEYAKITIIDNGHGIPAHLLEKIFEPFFTTKDVGKGTGLGLAMSFGAIQSHDGTIKVQSKAEQGTGFQIYLPIYNQDLLKNSLVSSATISMGCGETILLVDDNQTLREAQKEALHILGYKTIEAKNGKEAVKLFEQYQEHIDLVVTDITMPIMGGVVAAEKIRAIKPNIRIIFVTGYDQDDSLNGERLPTDGEFILDKPYTMGTLNKVIQKQLHNITQ